MVIKESTASIKCDDEGPVLVVDKRVFEDGDIDYDITVQDSRCDNKCTNLWSRFKSAGKILFGKPVYFSDVYTEDIEKFRKFVEQLNAMCHDSDING